MPDLTYQDVVEVADRDITIAKGQSNSGYHKRFVYNPYKRYIQIWEGAMLFDERVDTDLRNIYSLIDKYNKL